MYDIMGVDNTEFRVYDHHRHNLAPTLFHKAYGVELPHSLCSCKGVAILAILANVVILTPNFHIKNV